MFEIKSREDVELLKEISKCFIEEPSKEELNEILYRVKDFEDSFNTQNEVILGLSKQIKEMDKTIKKLSKENDEMLDRINKIGSVEKQAKIPKKTKEINKTRYLQNSDVFIPYEGAQKLYDKLNLDGIRLIHTSWNNQQYALPINVFELITILEAYKLGDVQGITVDNVNELCKEFGVTKMQFSKVYYNLLEDKFNDIIHEVDEMITQSMFTIKKGFIYRNDENTNISVNEFRQMCNEYMNSSRPFFTIYSIIKESSDYNAFDIFTILRKKDIILRILSKMD